MKFTYSTQTMRVRRRREDDAAVVKGKLPAWLSESDYAQSSCELKWNTQPPEARRVDPKDWRTFQK